MTKKLKLSLINILILSLFLCSCRSSCVNCANNTSDRLSVGSDQDSVIERSRFNKFKGANFFVWGNFQDRSSYQMLASQKKYEERIRRYGGQTFDRLNDDIDYVLIGYPIELLIWTEYGERISDIQSDEAKRYSIRLSEIVAWTIENNKMLISEDQFLQWIYGDFNHPAQK